MFAVILFTLHQLDITDYWKNHGHLDEVMTIEIPKDKKNRENKT